MNKVLVLLLILSWQALAKKAPDFTLKTSDGKTRSLSDFANDTVVLEWYNFGCPFVRKHYDTENMQKLQKKYTTQNIRWFQVISSAPGKQGYVNQKTVKAVWAKDKPFANFAFFDPEGKVGKLYGAKTTPHLFIVHKGELVYQGALDDQSSLDRDTLKKAKNYVALALDEIIAGKKVSIPKTKPYGCSVKYKD